jgi:hypothetical protein
VRSDWCLRPLDHARLINWTVFVLPAVIVPHCIAPKGLVSDKNCISLFFIYINYKYTYSQPYNYPTLNPCNDWCRTSRHSNYTKGWMYKQSTL